MKYQKGFTISEMLILLILPIILLGVGGWVANIYKLVQIISDPVTGMFILRAVGIFVAPLGAILGFI